MISDLRTILEDALERIKSEIFGPGREPSADAGREPSADAGREPSADDTESPDKPD